MLYYLQLHYRVQSTLFCVNVSNYRVFLSWVIFNAFSYTLQCIYSIVFRFVIPYMSILMHSSIKVHPNTCYYAVNYFFMHYLTYYRVFTSGLPSIAISCYPTNSWSDIQYTALLKSTPAALPVAFSNTWHQLELYNKSITLFLNINRFVSHRLSR